MSPQYGELRQTSGWDRSGSLGHACKFQWVSCLGSVTARHSSSGCQPNFAALNTGRHLYSAGRLSRWALAHISSLQLFLQFLYRPQTVESYLQHHHPNHLWKLWTTRMWANAQHEGRPAEYRWRPLFNDTKFGWRPLLECRAVTLPRHETRWNLQGAPNSWTDLSR